MKGLYKKKFRRRTELCVVFDDEDWHPRKMNCTTSWFYDTRLVWGRFSYTKKLNKTKFILPVEFLQ